MPTDDEERWLDEGGHEPPHLVRARLVADLIHANPAQRADLWENAVREYGAVEATRIGQDTKASSDTTASPS